MRITIYFLSIFMALWSVGASSQEYRDQKRSLIQWDKLDANRWLDLQAWKDETIQRDKYPNWEKIIRDRRLEEKVAKVIACDGECRIYRSEMQFKGGYRSTIYEGDELHTLGDSYVWVYLFDGTLLRLSPDSSVSFKELNIGLKTNFVHLRINSGNVLSLARSRSLVKKTTLRETDTMFFPLKVHAANPKKVKRSFGENELYRYLDTDNEKLAQYKDLNNLIVKNNEWVNKETRYFFVMPNGTIVGNKISVEFTVLVGGESFFKVRTSKQLRLKDLDSFSAKFYFRGFENTKQENLQVGSWYKVGPRGRSLSYYDEPPDFRSGEFVTSRIPTILKAREILMKQYSEFAFLIDDQEKLARNYGFRLWQASDEKPSDSEQRESFLLEYTRRIETSNLMASRKLRDRMKGRGDAINIYTYDNRFFKRALVNFYGKRESWLEDDGEVEQLNSTKKQLWKNMHGIY